MFVSIMIIILVWITDIEFITSFHEDTSDKIISVLFWIVLTQPSLCILFSWFNIQHLLSCVFNFYCKNHSEMNVAVLNEQ